MGFFLCAGMKMSNVSQRRTPANIQRVSVCVCVCVCVCLCLFVCVCVFVHLFVCIWFEVTVI